MDRFCYRCGKKLERPVMVSIKGKKHTTPFHEICDYVMAEDTKVDEERPFFYAIDSEEKEIEYAKPKDAELSPDKVRIEVRQKLTSVQKTGLVCPDCYKDTDYVIWGIHKK